MDELKLINGKTVMDSRDVAKMVEKQHKNLVRDISRYIRDIETGSDLSSLNFFIESKYQDAKDYGWSAVKMNRELAKRKVQYRQGQHWVLYSQYADKGYASYEAFAYKDDNKRSGVHNNLKWTQRGRKFIYDLLAKDGIRPTLEQMDLLEG